MKTLKLDIPDEILQGAENPAMQIPEDLKNYKIVEQEYTLKELAVQKKYWTEEIKRRSDLMWKVKHPLNILKELLRDVKAARFNLSVVKEMLAIANNNIYANIFYREATSGHKDLCNKLLKKYGAKKDKDEQSYLSSEIKTSTNDAAKSELLLEKYNAAVGVKIPLIELN